MYKDDTNNETNYENNEYIAMPDSSRTYQNADIPTVVFRDENIGGGSLREHVAIEPRLLDVNAIIVKSFARIHETNLKKQDILAHTFVNKEDYDKVRQDVFVYISDFNEMAAGKNLTVGLER